MVLANLVDGSTGSALSDSSLTLFQPRLSCAPKNMQAMIRDFFTWLECEWGQPVLRNFVADGFDLLSQTSVRALLDEQGTYTVADIASKLGYSLTKVQTDVRRQQTRPIGRITLRGDCYGITYNLYSGWDLAPVVERWERERLRNAIDKLWSRFLEEPCGKCTYCLNHQDKAGFYCLRNKSKPINKYRASLFNFLVALQQSGNLVAWWNMEKDNIFARKPGSMSRGTGLVLLYLLDRRLLQVSIDEFLHIPFEDLTYADFLRLWSNRRPEEYSTFLMLLKKTKYAKEMQDQILALLAILVLLRNGLPGVAELGRQLTSEEVSQAMLEERLLRLHVVHDVWLSFPLSNYICIGHLVLDEIRQYFWDYAAFAAPRSGKKLWGHGPRSWRQTHIHAIERILASRGWSNGQAILVPRPEAEKIQPNPHKVRLQAKQEKRAISLLPAEVQFALHSCIDYRYHQRRITLSTLMLDLRDILPFLCWAQEQPGLKHYNHWDCEIMRYALRAFLPEKFITSPQRRYRVSMAIHTFFQTLAEMDLPYAPGYEALQEFRTRPKEKDNPIPAEEVLDRVFHDGVCQLDYDPFARLALTIQYYCGTRVGETCELPLFCVLEDPNTGSAFLVIPFGKTKQERIFPIVSVGMGPLLQYMDQVFTMQVEQSPDGTSRETPRNLSRMNVRYLQADREKAYHWDYLFDQVAYSAELGKRRSSYLHLSRVCQSLKEAMLFAAKQNPKGLFQEGTYSPHCRRRLRKGQICRYFALQNGITICPVCGGVLSGTRGCRCYHRVAEEIICDGVAQNGEYFCPKCDAPLAKLVKITPNTYRHNSVTRVHRSGVSPVQNMLLHGHRTVPMHIRYLHLLPQDLQEAVCSIFSEQLLRQLRLEANYSPGQIIEEGVARTATVQRTLELTLYRGQKRRTTGVWGAFWAGALAEQGVLSPTQLQAEIIITEETYQFAVAQYRYEALGLAVSEVALERGTRRKFKAAVPSFLERREIETLVETYLENVQQGYLSTRQGVRLLEADIQKQRTFLNELEEILRPWWQHAGSIDRYVMALFPDIDNFSKMEMLA